MKIRNLISAIFALTIIIAGCSKDYLDTIPSSSTGSATIFETTQNAKLAVNGLSKLMTMQYIGTQGYNGEGTIKMYYGNYQGNHFTVNMPNSSNTLNSNNFNNTTSTLDYYPWYYYYRIISNANTIINNIDNASGPDNEKQYIKAQALTYRAYCFMMLSQLYSYRWSDSNNGASLGLILRLDSSSGDMERSTLGETYKQIYDDLEEAIPLYIASGFKRDNEIDDHFVINLEAAYAIYARASLNRQDYAKAAEMAVKARAGHSLMSVADYTGSGFSKPTSEWIWGISGIPEETLYFYQFFAYIGYNSTASAVKSYPKCISKELFDKIPSTDVRKGLFLDPAGKEFNATTGQASNAWRDEIRTSTGVDPTASVYAYMQFKMKAQAMAGVGHLNNFRSSEMYLIEAEANYFLNKENEARTAMNTLNKSSQRDPSYDCTATGTTLLEEIKMYRALELWGEGFDWFDMKRWGDPIERKAYGSGGSFVAALAVTIQPNENFKWTWQIPQKETDYNKLCQLNP